MAIITASSATSAAARVIVSGTSTMRSRVGERIRSRSAVCKPRADRSALT